MVFRKVGMRETRYFVAQDNQRQTKKRLCQGSAGKTKENKRVVLFPFLFFSVGVENGWKCLSAALAEPTVGCIFQSQSHEIFNYHLIWFSYLPA